MKNTVEEALEGLEMRKTPFAKNWFDVKTHLEKMPEHYVDMKAYRALCHKKGVYDAVAQKTLLELVAGANIVGLVADQILKRRLGLRPSAVILFLFLELPARGTQRQPFSVDQLLDLENQPDLLTSVDAASVLPFLSAQ